MASLGTTGVDDTVSSQGSTLSNSQGRIAITSLTSLFFMWGFITAMNDILIPHLKGVFDLTYTQAMLVQFCFFGAYFLVSMPAGYIVSKLGYKTGIALGLVCAAVGCVLFVPSAKLSLYWMFLLGLFVLASGVTILQVAANPLVTLIGNPDTASSRLNMTQAFNSLGTTVAPIIGGILIFGSVDTETNANHVETVIVPYLTLAAILVLLAVLSRFVTLPNHTSPQVTPTLDGVVKRTPLAHYKHLVLGAVGIFVYVGAEVSIGSFMISFLGEKHIAGLTESEAAHYVAYFWGGAMIGRFIGAAIMQKIRANRLLAFNSLAAIVLLGIAITSSGKVAMWALLATGLCNSIMFPTIFSLGIAKLGIDTSRGSGLLCLAIVGGAIIPVFQGLIADASGLQTSFLLPVICYVFIAFYGAKGYRPNQG
ncbi:sugar MFS transporter [Alteromonas sp. a30]|uniref:sugar MFS transporter n=1 Tax=Alteromonas sp. a30 TaxID=2730917 RepID=UPI0022830CEA|nr:sugar MFS transporter [Alteromonas sp. a30]MCY7294040.1 sugar MFS transporter [Alteromonas sp. a30]